MWITSDETRAKPSFCLLFPVTICDWYPFVTDIFALAIIFSIWFSKVLETNDEIKLGLDYCLFIEQKGIDSV